MNTADIEKLLASTDIELVQRLTNFIKTNERVFDNLQLKREAKNKLVHALVNRLDRDDTSAECRVVCLQCIRILSREKSDLDVLTTFPVLDCLKRCASLTVADDSSSGPNGAAEDTDAQAQTGDTNDKCETECSIATESLKCLCNLSFQSVAFATMCAERGCLRGLVQHVQAYKAKQGDTITRTFEMKFLFLITALVAPTRRQLVVDLHALSYLVDALASLAARADQQRFPPFSEVVSDVQSNVLAGAKLSDAEADLGCEILKVLFNLTLASNRHRRPEDGASVMDTEDENLFKHLVLVLRSVILVQCTSAEKGDELISNSVNLLTNVPRSFYEYLVVELDRSDIDWERHDMKDVFKRLVSISRRDASEKENEEASGSNTDKQKKASKKRSKDKNSAAANQQRAERPETDEPLTGKFVVYDRHDVTAIYVILLFFARRFALADSNAASGTAQSTAAASKQLRELVSPVLELLAESSRASRSIRKYCRLQVLPYLRDEVRSLPECGTRLRNRLCRALTSCVDTDVVAMIADFLFVLTKESVARLVKYTGYGNAAGLLAQRGLLAGGRGHTVTYSSESEDSETESYAELKPNVNPITGRYEVPRVNSALAEMTDEQREYETMKLVNAIDQLQRTGVLQPARIGATGRPEPVESVLQLRDDPQQNTIAQAVRGSDSESHSDSD